MSNKIFFLFSLFCVLISSCENEDDMVTSILLDKSDMTLKPGETYQFMVKGSPSKAKLPKINWGIYPVNANNHLAKIDSHGKLTALKPGNFTVNAWIGDDDITDLLYIDNAVIKAVCNVTVEPIEATGISIDKKEIVFNGEQCLTLNATVEPQNATNQQVYWEIDNSGIANLESTKDNSVIVTALNVGETIITARAGFKSPIISTCKVKVNPVAIQDFSLQETEKAVKVGDVFTIESIVTPTYATKENIKWELSDTNIAKINEDNSIAALSPGKCVVKAILEGAGLEATCELTVEPILLESISFDNYTYKIEVGGRKQLNVMFTPENATNKNVIWASSDPVIAPIDENGIVLGNTSGRVKVTATSEDGGHVASCTVYIVSLGDMMNVYFPTASLIINSGYYTGTMSCAIKNNSSQTVKLTRFYVYSNETNSTPINMTDLGDLKSGETITLQFNLSHVYEPAFIWVFECNGSKYNTWNKFKE
jgi:uncharacterized protein YjdB|nr:MAG TPA: Tail tube protein [Caudoviricetes sp.]